MQASLLRESQENGVSPNYLNFRIWNGEKPNFVDVWPYS